MQANFATWLKLELEKRSWKQADLVRASGLSDGAISHILNGTRQAGPEVCRALAHAFVFPPEHIFRLAGLLPPITESNDPTLQALSDIARNMSPAERQDLLEYALFRFRQKKVTS